MKLMKRLLCLCLSLMLVLPCLALAEDDEEELSLGLVYATLDEEDQQQWDEWDQEEAEEEEADTNNDADALSHAEQLADNSVTIDPSELEINENLPSGVINILLMGLDARKDVTTGRSDAILICSIDTSRDAEKPIKLTSIMRDTCVTIPGYKNQNRVNVAYHFGSMAGEKSGVANAGPALAMRTINHNFQMNIEYFVTVNIFGLAAIIDSMGGIDIEMSKVEANRINYELKKEPMDKVQRTAVKGLDGINSYHLDGMQAVTFARIRSLKGENDTNRTERQRRLLETLLNAVMQDMNLDKLANLMEAALPYVYTNLPTSKMFEIGGALIFNNNLLSNLQNGKALISQHRIPMDGSFGYKDINGSDMVYMNEKNFKLNIDTLQKFIYGEVYPK